MKWIALLIAIQAVALIKLGAMAVMVGILVAGLKIAVTVIVILTAVLLWKRWRAGKGSPITRKLPML